MADKDQMKKLKSAMLAAYAALQNKKPESAKECLIVGLKGGSVTNPLDFEKCLKQWNAK